MNSSFRFLFLCLAAVVVSAIAPISMSAACQTGVATPVTRVTDAFRIGVYVKSERVADQARVVAEKTWEVASDIYGAKMPAQPLGALLYRTTADYESIERKLTGGRFKRNLAFAHQGTFTAHVALQPYLTDAGLQEVGLPKQSAQLLAHEMAHVVRYYQMPHSMKNHPQWLLHGVATWIDKKVMLELGYSSSPEQDPNTGDGIQNVQKLLEQEKLPSVARLLNDEKLIIDFYDGYSVRWMLVDMLMTNYESGFRAFLKDMSRLGGVTRFFKTRNTNAIETHKG